MQDAAHRSGFFSARTYRINLRTAIRRALDAAGEKPTLAEFEAFFLDYWKKEFGDKGFIGVFLAPNMEWLEDYEQLKSDGTLPAGSGLCGLVERRTSWQVTEEFGFNSRIGRTLEKSGAAIAYVAPTEIHEAALELMARMKEIAGGFGSLTINDVTLLLIGLVHRLRTSGGIYHSELDQYVASGADTFQMNRAVHMPSFAHGSKAPTFFTMGTESLSRFEKLVAGGTNLSWGQRWAVKALKSIPSINAESAGLAVEEAVRALTKAGIFVKREAKGNQIWGIDPKRMRLGCRVATLGCSQCGSLTSCAEEEAPAWEAAPCLRPRCFGTYAIRADRSDYYGDLYRTGDVVRIRSAEHTGLLERQVREWTENRFMAVPPDQRKTDPNLLSCTPTLEMGVNIGDLSTVVLCSVPPATSNYVQRVGRAGRKEGASVSLTIAAGKAQDLYYFELPEDMMVGEIRPPGTFLNAPAVLERQLTAYCMDRWSEQSTPKPILPHRFGTVLDAVRAPKGRAAFPYDFFHFVDSNISELIAGFLVLFAADELTDSSRSILESFARGTDKTEGLTLKILKRITRVVEEQTDLRSRSQKVGKAIKKNKETVARDEVLAQELAELLQHRDGLYEMLKQINAKLTLNFLTDEGLLPNYAFPEEGVELRSIILKKREEPKEGEGKYKTLTYEYVRPGAAAISELAPGNVFYVEGRSVKVDQIGLGVSKPEMWHFCDSCGYMEQVSDNTPSRSECPACKSPNWTDASLRRELVRLRQVIATSLDSRSRSHDEKDERQVQFYSRHESVVIPADAEREAYQISGGGVPFGFEFLGKLTFRVVNLGEENPELHAFRLGGKEVTAGGFVLCPDCGKVQGRRSARGEEELKHDLVCRHRGKDVDPVRPVFLYRELHSEAIRILLPSTSADEDSAMSSFVASVHLGLRLYFKGGIEHLRGCVDEKPVAGTQLRRKYLVLYDQVPGGTGYLKELSKNPDAFLSVLGLALQHLRDCECQGRDDHESDGCHRCILQSRSRSNRQNLSRTTAIRLLNAILENADRIESVDQVSDIDIHPLIQSELEKNFLNSLRDHPGARLQPKIVRGKPGFLWRCGEIAWEIGLQVKIGADAVVQSASIPDFVLYPVRTEQSRPVAIFLDGFAFHAEESSGHNRIAKDVEQRQALFESGKYWVWSFSWEDIQFRHDAEKIQFAPLGEQFAGQRDLLAEALLGKGDELGLAKGLKTESSWSLFLRFLLNPSENRWRAISQMYALALPSKLQLLVMPDLRSTIESMMNSGSIEQIANSGPGDGYGATFDHSPADGFVVSSSEGIAKRDAAAIFLALRFNDEAETAEPAFASHWRGFLRLMNRIQFLPNRHIITVKGCKLGLFYGVTDAYQFFLSGGSPAVSDSFPSVYLSLADPAIAPMLQERVKLGLPMPSIGYELEQNGLIIGTAELAWLEQKVAVIENTQVVDSKAFRIAGWNVLTFTKPSILKSEIDQICSIIQSTT